MAIKQLGAAPTNPQDTATKSYVDQANLNDAVKQAVRLVSRINVVVASDGLTAVDAVGTADGDRVLLIAQTTAMENGIWIAHTGPWTRAPDMAVGMSVLGASINVYAGQNSAGTSWLQRNTSAAVVGTTALTFVQSGLLTGTGLSISNTATGVATIGVAFGAVAQTAAQGNDSRFYPPSSLSTALPASPVVGQRVYVTDLAQEWLFNGAVWVVSVAGQTDTAWTPITAFLNGWVDAGAPNAAGFRKVGGRVFLRGRIKSGTVSVGAAFTLPAGYASSVVNQNTFPIVCNNAFGAALLEGTNIAIYIGSNIWADLSSISYDTL